MLYTTKKNEGMKLKECNQYIWSKIRLRTRTNQFKVIECHAKIGKAKAEDETFFIVISYAYKKSKKKFNRWPMPFK